MTTALDVSAAAPARRRAARRVAAIIDTAQLSGPGRQLLALAGRLAERGVELCVLTPHRAGRAESPFVAGLARAGITHAVVEERGPFDPTLVARARAQLAAWAPDVVQTHGYKGTVLAYALRRLGARWPWVAFFHGATAEDARVRAYNFVDRQLLGRADALVVMSERHAAAWRRRARAVRVIHNAVLPPSDALAPRPLSTSVAELCAHAARPLLGVVARLSPEKGVDVFLEACAKLRARDVGFSAVVAGDGPERAALETQRDALALRDRVHFLGALPSAQPLYEHLDLLVIPSRSEGLPNALLEALGADVPVTATDVGGVPEVLAGTRAGVLVPPASASALADGIAAGLALAGDPAARAARHEAVERFSLERRVSAHLALYGELLAGRAR